MSYIDTILHEQVGHLAGYPLYHPLDTRVAARGDYDFGCSPQNIVLGGGSGEHPGMVVHHLQAVAEHYLMYRLEATNQLADRDLRAALESLDDSLVDRMTPLHTCLETCGWQIEQFAELVLSCQAAALPTPYSPVEHTSVEHWLVYSLGEWLWFERPDLLNGASEDITSRAPGFAAWLGGPTLRNVQLPTGL